MKVTGKGDRNPWDLDQETVDQIWAEVQILAEAGEPLFLTKELEEYARAEQREAMEQDDREGLVRDYLEMLLPECWDRMDLMERRRFILDRNDPTLPKGVRPRTQVCNLEIWTECFGKDRGDIRPRDTYSIKAIMMRIENWERTDCLKDFPIYGRQRVYVRKEEKTDQ